MKAKVDDPHGIVNFWEEGNCWLITTQPHIALRLKRVFPKISPKEQGILRLADTPENARDLEWFIDRYPHDCPTIHYLRTRAKKHKEQEALVAQLLKKQPDNRPRIERKMAKPPREYQVQLAEMVKASGGLLCADDLGLGKSISGITAGVDPDLQPFLVVCMPHLCLQWRDFVREFAPHLKTHIIHHGTPYNFKDKWGDLPDVLICSYSKLCKWAETLAAVVKYVIWDEVQELRHEDTQKYAAARVIADATPYRLGLSATPIYNYGIEMFNVMRCIRPDALGSRDEFVTEWCAGESVREPRAFGEYLRRSGLMLRRTRAEVGRELPKCTTIVQPIECDEKYLESGLAGCDDLANLILRKGESFRGQKMQAAAEFDMRMRQATGIAKAPYAAEFVRMLVEGGQKVVLCGWHRAVYAIWLERLKDLNPVLYTGSESPNQKNATKERFVNGDAMVLLLSLRSGAGLDGLQYACSTIVKGELDWSPGVHDQCLSSDTEVLTDKGFRSKHEVSVGDTLCAFDFSTGAMRWVKAEAKTERPLRAGERMFSTATEKIDLRVTGQHRMVVRRKRRTNHGITRSEWFIDLAEDLSGKARRFVPISGMQESPGCDLTSYELRLIGWFLTDGELNKRTRSLIIHQAASQPWNADIVETLNGCGLKWSMWQRLNKNGILMNRYRVQKKDNHRWSDIEIQTMREMLAAGSTADQIATAIGRSKVGVEKKNRKQSLAGLLPPAHHGKRGWALLAPYLDKDMSPLLESITRNQLKDLLHGIEMGDGAKGRVNVSRITNTNKLFLDRLQSLCVRRGISANISERSSQTKANKPVYDLWISEETDASIPRPDKPNGFRECLPLPGERVWCLTNELGTLVTRRNGKVAIVGNCIGRIDRDGQPNPIFAYYLLCDFGSDPIVADTLGLKRQQSEGIRDPNAEMVTALQVDPEHVKKLAAAYLRKRSLTIR
jgi:hypothetical protein